MRVSAAAFSSKFDIHFLHQRGKHERRPGVIHLSGGQPDHQRLSLREANWAMGHFWEVRFTFCRARKAFIRTLHLMETRSSPRRISFIYRHRRGVLTGWSERGALL